MWLAEEAAFIPSRPPTGAYAMLCLFCALGFRWAVRLRSVPACGSNDEKTALGILHEAVAAAVLALSYMDRRWIMDSTFEHPYDPLIPAFSNSPSAQVALRLWQQFWLPILWVSLGAAFVPGPPVKRMPRALTEAASEAAEVMRLIAVSMSVVAMCALGVSDIYLWGFQHIFCLTCLLAIMIRSYDGSFPALWAVRISLSMMYIFSGLNKINSAFMEGGAAFFMPMLSSWLSYSAVGRSFGLAIVLGEALCGASLIFPTPPWLRRTGASLLVMMHVYILCFLWVVRWNYVVMPVNVVCIVGLYFTAIAPGDVAEERIPLATSSGSSAKARRRISFPVARAAFFGHLIVLQAMGPASYVVSSSPMWPNNMGMAFALYDFNPISYSIETGPVQSTTHAALATMGLLADGKGGGRFNSQHFLMARHSFGTESFPDGLCTMQSERGQLRLAAWLAERLETTVTVTITDKMPLGLRPPTAPRLSHRYACSPVCKLA